MYTVIILNHKTADLIKKYRFLFAPYEADGRISFCEWIETGTDIESAVPNLYKVIKGKTKWRAFVLNTDSIDGYREAAFIPDEKNPFDYQSSLKNGEKCVEESEIPIVRLSHMLGGYMVSNIVGFEKAYEYFDPETGALKRVKETDLGEGELDLLSERYGRNLKMINEEKYVPDDIHELEVKLAKKYSFADVRPQSINLIATRKKVEDDDNTVVRKAWDFSLEHASSRFWEKHNYSNNCRFLFFNVSNPENSRFEREMFEFWLSILTFAINDIQPSELQAYRLYKLSLVISEDELTAFLSSHLNKLNSATRFIDEQLAKTPELSFHPEDEIVGTYNINVQLEPEKVIKLHVDPKTVGLCGDCPTNELKTWNGIYADRQEKIAAMLRSPRRSLSKSAALLKAQAESFYGDEYELDEFQIMDVEEKLDLREEEIIQSRLTDVLNKERIQNEMREADKKVKKVMRLRLDRKIVVWSGVIALVIFLIGFIPYLVNMFKDGDAAGKGTAVLLTCAALLLVAVGGVIALIFMRRPVVEQIENFNNVMHNFQIELGDMGKRFSDYFSSVCTYMKAKSVLLGTKSKEVSISSERKMLRLHKLALKDFSDFDESVLKAYQRYWNRDYEIDGAKLISIMDLPKDNNLYYYETCREEDSIPLNDAGDMITAPYDFVGGLMIDREELYDDY